MSNAVEIFYYTEQYLFIVLGIVCFLGLYFISSYLLKYLKRFRHNRLLNSTEYLPKEETQTLKQVFYLLIITLCFVDIIYSLIFWSSDAFHVHFIFYDIAISLIASLTMKRERRLEKIILISLIPISSLAHTSFEEPLILLLLLLAFHFIGLTYVIKEYYIKFIQYTESNELGISILLLFAIVFFSFIFTSFAERKNLLDSLVMVSNAFTSNGYAVLGDSVIGKLNSIFLVWGGYILSGVGTATLSAALVSRHFNKKFEELEELIKNNNDKTNEKNNDKTNDKTN